MYPYKKIRLGCANFGQTYGLLANKNLESEAQVHSILSTALDNGIFQLDTAQAYGVSEEVIGRFKKVQDFEIATKISAATAPGKIVDSVRDSLVKLNIEKVDRVLLHDPESLCGDRSKDIYKNLVTIKELGLADSVGISVYDVELMKTILTNYRLDWVQAPVNVFDRRFINNETSDLLSVNDCKLEARSIFLQGILLADLECLNNRLPKAKVVVNNFKRRCEELGLSRVKAALLSIINNDSIHSVVLGVNSTSHLVEIISILKDDNFLDVDISLFADEVKPQVYDPRNW